MTSAAVPHLLPDSTMIFLRERSFVRPFFHPKKTNLIFSRKIFRIFFTKNRGVPFLMAAILRPFAPSRTKALCFCLNFSRSNNPSSFGQGHHSAGAVTNGRRWCRSDGGFHLISSLSSPSTWNEDSMCLLRVSPVFSIKK